VLSFDSLMGSSGGVVVQSALGKAADVYSYGTSYAFGAAIQLAAVPFLFLSRREQPPSDTIVAAADAAATFSSSISTAGLPLPRRRGRRPGRTDRARARSGASA
jgi:hypothetical protein